MCDRVLRRADLAEDGRDMRGGMNEMKQQVSTHSNALWSPTRLARFAFHRFHLGTFFLLTYRERGKATMGAPSGPLLSSARRSAVRVNGAPSAAGATMVMVSRVALVLRVRPDRHRKFAGDFHVVDGRARTESSERREACRCVSVCASARFIVHHSGDGDGAASSWHRASHGA